MTTPTPPTAGRRWFHFWFAPADPTTMAFIRVVTGLLVLYTHLAYSFDLYAFFGEKGWYGLDAINRERREFPWASSSFTDGWKWWEETARFPDEPHRRAALMAFTRDLPADPAVLERKLAMLAVDRPDGYPLPAGRVAMQFVNGLNPDPKFRPDALKALIGEIPRDPARDNFPPALEALVASLAEPGKAAATNPKLQKLKADLEELYWTQPGYTEDLIKAVVPFVSTLPDDPAARAEALKAVADGVPHPRYPAPEAFKSLVDETRKDDPNRLLRKLARDLEDVFAARPKADRGPPTAGDRKIARDDAWKQKLQALADARKYVALYFLESDDVHLINYVRFARDLACPAAEREKKLEYFRYWNAEKRFTTSTGNPIFSIWFHIHTPTEMAVAHAVMLCIMLMFTLGLFTRVTAVLTWLCCVSYIHRNQQVLFGQDTMMNILLLYLMVANCGATLSLDRLIARYRAAKGSLRRCGFIDGPTAAYLAAPSPSVASGFAQRLLQIHFCFIYMAAGLSKLKGAAWWNTGAFWDTMANPEFTLIHYEWYQDLLRLMVGERFLYASAAAFTVGFTLFVEIGLPFLVWTKLRPYIIIAALFMHFGIGMFMGLLIFSLLMMTMLVSYLPGSVIRRQLFGLPPAEKTRLTVDPTNPADVSKIAWAVAKDSAGKLEVAKR